MMNCERCNGLMVRDGLYQVEDQFLEVGRCLNCGHTIDLTILKMQTEKNGMAVHGKVLV